jgi:hypothetical protein
MAAAGEISLNEDVLVQVRQIKEQEQEKLHQQQLRKKYIYDTLQVKVSAIRQNNYHQRSAVNCRSQHILEAWFL